MNKQVASYSNLELTKTPATTQESPEFTNKGEKLSPRTIKLFPFAFVCQGHKSKSLPKVL